MTWLRRMDWELLRKQKDWLLEQQNASAAGLVNMLDALQDAAVDELGIPEEKVFGFAYQRPRKTKCKKDPMETLLRECLHTLEVHKGTLDWVRDHGGKNSKAMQKQASKTITKVKKYLEGL